MTVSRLLVTIVAAFALGGFATPAWANDVLRLFYYEALLDLDENTATGGGVSVVQANETPHDEIGIDYIVRAYIGVEPDEARGGGAAIIPSTDVFVVQRDVLRWNSLTSEFDLIDDDHTMYPVGEDEALHGFVEFGAPLNLLGNPTDLGRGLFHSTRTVGPTSDYTREFGVGSTAGAPVLSHLALTALAGLLLLGGAGLLRRQRPISAALALVGAVALSASIASAAAIVLDGDFSDWTGIAPVVTDPRGDQSLEGYPAEDILAGYAIIQGGNAFFRVNLESRPLA